MCEYGGLGHIQNYYQAVGEKKTNVVGSLSHFDLIFKIITKLLMRKRQMWLVR